MKKLYILLFIITLIVLYVCFAPVKIPVLTYHDFVDGEPTNNMQISKKAFEEEMKYLADHHYKSLEIKDIECFLKKECNLPKKSVLITMDDGWKSELEIAAPILKKYHLKATIFYVGENLSKENENFMSLEDLETLIQKYPNIEIASHSYSLHQEKSYKLSKEEITKDMQKMKESIISPYYAYPYGKYSEDYQEALKDEGYRLAFTFGPGGEHRKLTQKDSCYELPRLNMSNGMPLWKFILRLNWYK
ncbi:MAG: polysaccharide deacetylase family protein [Bacilli bacterium]|nr:polysaccharide deacetylase family protein [Bacilli bacterium]